MANYIPPSGYANSDDIMRLQQQLNASGANLKVDGKYGPLTDAAYQANGLSGESNTSPFSAKQQEYMNALMSGLKSTNEDEYLSKLQAALRPSVDAAIQERQKQTLTNRANIDVDAASRGMLGSTWVTDVKDRQQQYEADDIAGMENQYNASLAGNLANYQAAALSRDDSNYWNATQMANSLYQNDLAQSKRGSGLGNDEFDPYAAMLAWQRTQYPDNAIRAVYSLLNSEEGIQTLIEKGYSAEDIKRARADADIINSSY